MKAFGLNSREPGKVEKDLIIKWTDIYCFETDIIVEACNRTMKATHQPSFEYADSILTKWHTSNIRSSEDIRKADAQYEAGKAAKAAKSSNVIKQNANRFNNYQQRPKKSDDWYNSLLSNNN
ncbi:MAG: DnaD domain protein [Lachnospira eligens]